MCRGLKEKIKSRWYFHGIQHHRWRYYWGHHDLSYNNVFDPFKVIRLRVFWKYCFLIDLSNFAPADPSPGNNTTIPETATASPATPKMPCALKKALFGCCWLLLRLILVASYFLLLSLQAYDIQAKAENSFWSVVMPHFFFICLNSMMLLEASSRWQTSSLGAKVFYWSVFYYSLPPDRWILQFPHFQLSQKLWYDSWPARNFRATSTSVGTWPSSSSSSPSSWPPFWNRGRSLMKPAYELRRTTKLHIWRRDGSILKIFLQR